MKPDLQTPPQPKSSHGAACLTRQTRHTKSWSEAPTKVGSPSHPARAASPADSIPWKNSSVSAKARPPHRQQPGLHPNRHRLPTFQSKHHPLKPRFGPLRNPVFQLTLPSRMCSLKLSITSNSRQSQSRRSPSHLPKSQPRQSAAPRQPPRPALPMMNSRPRSSQMPSLSRCGHPSNSAHLSWLASPASR